MDSKCSLDESQNFLGPGKCKDDMNCKGKRKCVKGLCEGVDFCSTDNLKKCSVDESKN